MTDEYLARFRRIFSTGGAAAALERTRAIIGPASMPVTDEGRLAQQALDALEHGKQPDSRALAALELVIKMTRPAPLSRNGVLDSLPPGTDQAFPQWASFSTRAKPFLYSIGRIDLAPDQGVGTGFLVKDDLLVTNAHVVAYLSRDTNQLTRGQAMVRFIKEYGNFADDPPVDILEVIALDAETDIALLRISDPKEGSPRVPLNFHSGDAAPGQTVVAIGYPFNDPQRNPMFISGIFGTRFGVKRAAPGEVVTVQNTDFSHDCSTLGGNSGSPMLSMDDAGIVGLHKEGIFMFRNSALKGSRVKAFVEAHT
jgi:S1-C subfamily serine protease